MKTIMTIAFLSFITLTTSAVATEPSSKVAATVSVSSFQSFRVHRQGTSVVLVWNTATSQAQHFLIERSYDGIDFETINTVGANGTSSYKVSDDAPYAGYSYYRITAVNADATIEASPIEMIRIVQRK